VIRLIVLLTGCLSVVPGQQAPPVPTATAVRAPLSRLVSADGELVPVDATPIVAPADSDRELKIAWLAPEGRRMSKGDIVVGFDATQAMRDLAEAEGSLASARRRLERERRQSDAQLRARAERAALAAEEQRVASEFQARDQEIYSRQQLLASALDGELLQARQEHAEASQQIEGSLARSRQELLRIEAERASNAIARAKKALSLLELPAPHDGVLLPKKDWRGNSVRTGDTIWPGQPVGEIPALGALDAKVWVLEADAAGLQVGRAVVVTVATRPGTPLQGKVKRAESLARPRPNLGPIQYFEVLVSLDTTDPSWMKPGQRVTASLDLGSADSVVVPRQAVFQDGDGAHSFRREGSAWERVPVVLGIGSAGRVTVQEGVKEGDVLALRDPTAKGGSGANPEARKAKGPGGPAAGGPGGSPGRPGGRGGRP
jgi:multidrug efflux pump subunit AcrA (membrane-fusion protein)